MSEIGNMVISNSLTELDCVFVTVQIVKLLHLQAVKKEALTHFNSYRLNKTGLKYVTISIYTHPIPMTPESWKVKYAPF